MQLISQDRENGTPASRKSTGLIRESIDIANLKRGYSSDGRLGPSGLNRREEHLNQATMPIMRKTMIATQ